MFPLLVCLLLLPCADTAPRLDAHGDPLPHGAVARIGTLRWQHPAAVTALAFAPDGNTLLSGCAQGNIRLWDVCTGKLIRVVGQCRKEVTELAFAADAKTVASVAAGTGEILLWDAEAGRALLTICSQDVQKITFAPDGRTLASADSGRTLRLWEVATGKALRTWTGEELKGQADASPFYPPIAGVAFSANGKALAVTDSAGLRIFDPQTNQETVRLKVREYKRNPITVPGPITVSADFKRVAAPVQVDLPKSGEPVPMAQLWDTAAMRLLRTVGDVKRPAVPRGFSPDGAVLVTAGPFQWGVPQGIRFWNVNSGKEIARLEDEPLGVRIHAFSPNGRIVATGDSEGQIHLWDPATGKELPSTQRSPRTILFPQFARNSHAFVTADFDSVFLWDAATGRKLQCLRAPHGILGHPVFLRDGRSIVAVDGNRTLRMWDMVTGREKTLPVREQNPPDQLWANPSFTADDRILAVSDLSKTLTLKVGDRVFPAPPLRLFDWQSGKELPPFRGKSRWFGPFDFSPDSKTLAAMDRDRRIGLWDLATGRQSFRFPDENGDPTNSIAFSSDGTALVGASQYGRKISVWDVVTGKESWRIQHSAGEDCDNTPAFSPDNRAVITQMNRKEFRVRSATDGRFMYSLKATNDQFMFNLKATNLLYSHDGRMLVVPEARDVVLYEAATGKSRRLLQGHQVDISSASFSFDDRYLVTADHANTLLIWDLFAEAP